MDLYETVIGTMGIFQGQTRSETTSGLWLFQALDLFLVGFLFLIFSIEFLQLFYPKPSRIMDAVDNIAPNRLHVENFTQLKLIL